MHGIQKYNILQEGLFLSPDPVLQDPANALPACRNTSTGRNYNRYSYVLPVPKSEATSGNNPLKYTDPSGYLFYYKGAWLSDYKDWVSNPFGSSGGGSFESPGSGGGSRRGDSRLDAYSDFVQSLGTTTADWSEYYAFQSEKPEVSFETWSGEGGKAGVKVVAEWKGEWVYFANLGYSYVYDNELTFRTVFTNEGVNTYSIYGDDISISSSTDIGSTKISDNALYLYDKNGVLSGVSSGGNLYKGQDIIKFLVQQNVKATIGWDNLKNYMQSTPYQGPYNGPYNGLGQGGGNGLPHEGALWLMDYVEWMQNNPEEVKKMQAEYYYFLKKLPGGN